MSGSMYRLETPRPRPPPPPLRFQNSHKSPPPMLNNQGSQTLLYDLPPSTMASPPTSPLATQGVVTPSSPSFPSGRARGRRNGRPCPTPPPSARNRSVTPLGVSRSDLENFAEYCRAWYFDQEEASGRQMTQTLANLPPAQRAPFSRLQASIRSAFHSSIKARRHAEFQAHISAMSPGGSLMPHSRSDPNGVMARKERFDRFDRFIRSWCTMGMPGTQPFFEALWAIMRLQVLPEHLGGAGGNRIRWELDDAVFKEAAGKNFMLEAIDVLKGVLAFEEVSASKKGSCSGLPTSPAAHSRSRSQPLPNDSKPGQSKVTPISVAGHGKRARAPSDPFLDTPPALSHSVPSASSQSSGVTMSHLLSSTCEGIEQCTNPNGNIPQLDEDEVLAPLRSECAMEESEEYLRIWTSADLPDFEYISLLTLFPSFITRRPLLRFPVTPSAPAPDIEQGEDERDESKEIRFGSGAIWVASMRRGDGWKGGWWTRFVLWWRRLFC